MGVLGSRTNQQRQEIAAKFEQEYGKVSSQYNLTTLSLLMSVIVILFFPSSLPNLTYQYAL